MDRAGARSPVYKPDRNRGADARAVNRPSRPAGATLMDKSYLGDTRICFAIPVLSKVKVLVAKCQIVLTDRGWTCILDASSGQVSSSIGSSNTITTLADVLICPRPHVQEPAKEHGNVEEEFMHENDMSMQGFCQPVPTISATRLPRPATAVSQIGWVPKLQATTLTREDSCKASPHQLQHSWCAL